MHSDSDSRHSRSHLRPVWITLLFFIPCLGLTYLLNQWTGGTPYIPSNILVLTMVNVDLILLVLLILLLSRNLVKAFFERRVGSAFRAKLILAFVGFSLIPSGLLFLVASGLLTNSVNNWFSIQVEQSLTDALDVSQAYYQDQRERTHQNARVIRQEIARANALSTGQRESLISLLEQHRAEYALAAIEIWSPTFEPVVAVVDPRLTKHGITRPVESLLRGALSGEGNVSLESTGFGRLIRVGLPVFAPRNPGDASTETIRGIVVVSRVVPEAFVAKGEEIMRSYEDYRQLKAFKNPIKTVYIMSFAVIAMTILFSATWFGIYLGRRITIPIQKLAEATKAVAAGNLDVHIDAKADGEIGTLVDSFNKMAEDLRVSRAELVKAQKLAAWREVAQRLAHEIKNPLTPIQLSAQRLRKKCLEGYVGIQQTVQEATGIIINEVQSLMRLVDSFSTFARMPAPVMAQESLHDVIREVSLLYNTVQRDVEVCQHLDETVPLLPLDREQMKRVFVNLFENAIEAMDNKGRIVVQTRYDAGQQKVFVEIHDQGRGIRPEDRDRLFLPHFSNKTHGTGLGLAIVNRIVTDHHGHIHVASNGSVGTTFTIELAVHGNQAPPERVMEEKG